MGLPALSLLLALAGAPGVQVEPSTTSTLPAALERLLAEELPPGTLTSTPAGRLRVTLDPTGGALSLRARLSSGALVLERAIDLGGGAEPALRVAVLLVREALEAAGRAERASTVPEAPVRVVTVPPVRGGSPPLQLQLGLVVGGWSWQRPLLPALALGGAVDLWLGERVQLRLLALFAGQLCCDRVSADVRARLGEIVLLGGLGVALFRLDVLRFDLEALLGIDLLSGEVSGEGYASPATAAAIREQPAVGLLAAGLALPLAPELELRLRAGARLTASPRSIQPPAGFPPSTRAPEPLETGYIAPFAALQLALRVF